MTQPQLPTGPDGRPATFTTSVTPEEVEAQKAERTKKEKTLDIVKAYGRSPEVIQRFANLIGQRPGMRYVESVIIACQENEGLLECTPKSIFIAAMRAASLQLSVDPSLRQAHLVPYSNHGTKEVKFIPDYHGLLQLTSSTGMYTDPPNVSEVYVGEEVEVNRYSGRVTITGKPSEPKVIKGWLAYYKDVNNAERFLYMTNEECDAHGKKYNPGGFGSSKTPWATDRDKMRRKTCLRIFLTQWGYFSPSVKTIVFDEEEGEVMDGEFSDLPELEEVTIIEKEKRPHTENDNLSDLGYNPDPVQDKLWNDWRSLCARAKKVKVPVADVKRESMTQPELQQSYDELMRFVLDAEDQGAVQ